jgi:hypothetical protein
MKSALTGAYEPAILQTSAHSHIEAKDYNHLDKWHTVTRLMPRGTSGSRTGNADVHLHIIRKVDHKGRKRCGEVKVSSESVRAHLVTILGMSDR